jgi:hypothetical protein
LEEYEKKNTERPDKKPSVVRWRPTAARTTLKRCERYCMTAQGVGKNKKLKVLATTFLVSPL